MRKYASKIAISIVLVLSLSIGGCSTKPAVVVNPPPVATTPPSGVDAVLFQLAVQTDRAAVTLNALVDIKRALLKDGIITKPQSAIATSILLKAVRAGQTLKTAAQGYDDFKTGKTELLGLIEAFTAAVTQVVDQLGLFGEGSALREKVTALFGDLLGSKKKIEQLAK